MIRREQGTFRTWTRRLNVTDDQFGSNAVTALRSQWTSGATQIDRVTILNPTTDKASVLGLTVSARMALEQTTNAIANNVSAFGKLGKIVTGITTEEASETSTPRVGEDLPYVHDNRYLPADITLLGDLWDPAINPLPPLFNQGAADAPIAGGSNPVGLQVGVTHTLPVPVPIPRGGTSLFVGIWIEPSLSVCDQAGSNPACQLGVYDAKWFITYDDGT